MTLKNLVIFLIPLYYSVIISHIMEPFFPFFSSYLSMVNEVSLQASRKRSLYTMATAMLLLSAKASDLPQIVVLVRESTSDQLVSVIT